MPLAKWKHNINYPCSSKTSTSRRDKDTSIFGCSFSVSLHKVYQDQFGHRLLLLITRIFKPLLLKIYTLQSHGSRMGGGKGNIDHYVTPVKAGQVIFEVGGKIEFFEVFNYS